MAFIDATSMTGALDWYDSHRSRLGPLRSVLAERAFRSLLNYFSFTSSGKELIEISTGSGEFCFKLTLKIRHEV